MEFEWDEAKSEDCRRRRGFDFAFAAQLFDSALTIEWEDTTAIGEQRYNVIGPIGDHVYLVTYTERGNVIRIISARPAEKAEVRVWQDTL